MGSDAELFVFDYACFAERVVPAVREWARVGRVPPSFEYEPPERIGTNLVAHCTLLGVDLRYLGPDNVGESWFDDWETRRCRSLTCPSRVYCPWHATDVDAPSAANLFIDLLVEFNGCLGPARFLGRTVNTGDYASTLDGLGVEPSSPVHSLLGALGSRGRLIGWLFGNSDGIHGWLDPEETRRLAEHLWPLALPPVYPTLDSIDREAYQPGPHNGLKQPWDEWSLSVVRAMCSIAADNGFGVLWGNDVGSDNAFQLPA